MSDGDDIREVELVGHSKNTVGFFDELGGGDIRGVQFAECCKLAVTVVDDGDITGGE